MVIKLIFYYVLSIEKNVKRYFKNKRNVKKLMASHFCRKRHQSSDNKAGGGKAKNNNLFVKNEDFKLFLTKFYSTYYTIKNCIPIMKKIVGKNSYRIINIGDLWHRLVAYGSSNQILFI